MLVLRPSSGFWDGGPPGDKAAMRRDVTSRTASPSSCTELISTLAISRQHQRYVSCRLIEGERYQTVRKRHRNENNCRKGKKQKKKKKKNKKKKKLTSIASTTLRKRTRQTRKNSKVEENQRKTMKNQNVQRTVAAFGMD